MPRGRVTLASRVQVGDEILEEGEFVSVSRVQRARGRKPKVGENLEFVSTDGQIVKRNSATAVRVLRPG